MGCIRRHLTYANVLATLALLVALAGGAYAATALPRDSVRSAQIAPGAVGTTDIAAGAVTSAKVRDGSLTAVDFTAGQLRALRGAQGEPGPPGEVGPPGEPGAPGAAAATDVVTRFSASVGPVAFNAFASVTAVCAAGETLVGGGGGFLVGGAYDDDAGQVAVSAPVVDVASGGTPPAGGEVPSGWRLSAKNYDQTGQARDMRAYALCARR